MGRNEKAALSLRKTLAISLIFIFILGIKAVIASNAELNSVTIQFSNNHEITVLTSRTKVSEILADNNIILASNETVLPSLDEEITETRRIKIFEIGSEEFEVIEVAESPDENSVEDILQRYEDIKHKIEIVEEEIPFETITRDVSSGSTDTDNRVIEQGRNGLRETKYKITFQNDIEIARVELETRVVREPQNRIVQTQNRPTTRSGARDTGDERAVVESGWFQATAYCACAAICTRGSNVAGQGITASGARATANRTIAAPTRFPFGTQMRIWSNGNLVGVFTVEDRGGAVVGNILDIYKGCHQTALGWGRRQVYVEILQ
ncbi:MAG: G5 domain-containing protein [Oscillospiraceae bacterium]|nr:G5 domain-containing protein [Oscillospiraceae bacterium]